MPKKPRLLIVAKTAPLFDRASGDFRLFQILRALASEYSVDFVSTQRLAQHKSGQIGYPPRDSYLDPEAYSFIDGRYFDELKKIGVRPLTGGGPSLPFTVRPGKKFDLRPYLLGEEYDLVFFEFYYVAKEYIREVRQLQPGAAIIVDSVDLHFKRLYSEINYFSGIKYVINDDQEKVPVDPSWKAEMKKKRRIAALTRKQELATYASADAVAVVGSEDEATLRAHSPSLKLLQIPNIHPFEVADRPPGFEGREGLVFVGNFDHNPNLSSVLTIKHELAPLIRKDMGKIPIYIVGSNPSEKILNVARTGHCADQFIVTGYVPDTRTYLDKAKISIAPIPFGAGMNGKIGEALAAGIPVVTNTLGAKGMGLTHEINCLVADDSETFAAQVNRLYWNPQLWKKLSDAGRDFIRKKFAYEEYAGTLRSEIASCLPKRKEAKADKLLRSFAAPARKRVAGAIDREVPFPALTASSFLQAADPEVSVVLVTRNQWAYTELCLRSLAASGNDRLPHEILVIDNDSQDETPRKLAKIPGIKLLRNRTNAGFPAACNQGIEAARGKHIVLLNNDTVVPRLWLERLYARAATTPNLGLAGVANNTETGQTIEGVFYGSLREYLAKAQALARRYSGCVEDRSKISGMCMFIPRSTIDRLGPLETKFGPGYFEDDDYCLRVQEAGLRTVLVKEVYLHHFGSASFTQSGLNKKILMNQSMQAFIQKWGERALGHLARDGGLIL